MVFKYLAKGYVPLLFIAYGIFLSKSLENPIVWSEIATWINWATNFMGIFAFVLFAYYKRIFPVSFWKTIFVIMLGVYSAQLWESGLLDSKVSSAANFTILINYLFLVMPLVFVTAYFSFSKKKKANEK